MKNDLRTLLLGIVATVLIVAVSACSGSAPTQAANANNTAVPQAANNTAVSQAQATTASNTANSSGTATIASSTLMQDNGSGAAGNEVKSFKPTDHAQYFKVQLNGNVNVGSKVNWIFTAVDTTAGKDIKIADLNVTADVAANILSGKTTLDKDFPVGKYKADISVDGAPLGTIEYTVDQ